MLLQLSHFFSPLSPSAMYPGPSSIHHPYFMSMGHIYEFFGFSISYTLLNLLLSSLYLPISALNVYRETGKVTKICKKIMWLKSECKKKKTHTQRDFQLQCVKNLEVSPILTSRKGRKRWNQALFLYPSQNWSDRANWHTGVTEISFPWVRYGSSNVKISFLLPLQNPATLTYS